MNKSRVVPIIFIVLLSMMLSACRFFEKAPEAENYVQTLAVGSVQMTMQAIEIENLKATIAQQEGQLAAPPPTCPECPACATAEPCPTSAPCATAAPCSTAEPCPTAAPCPTSEPCPACPTPVASPTPEPTATLKYGSASLSGKLSYPSEYIPAQRIVAFEVKTGYYYWLRTSQGNATYKLDGLPAGTYVVMAYMIDGKSKAGYSVSAACDLTCGDDHTLVQIELKEGEHKTGINPIDWYAPEGVNWPAEPSY